MDVRRPNGLGGGLTLAGHARDLLTGSDGSGRVAAEARLTATVSARPYVVEAVATEPGINGGHLVGEAAVAGFRAVLARVTPEHLAARSPLYQLLDEIPVAVLVSGQVIGYAYQQRVEAAGGGLPVARERQPDPRATGAADQCAGWRVGATIMGAYDRDGFSPVVRGPLAPSLDDDDPMAWHPMEALPPLAMRRRRRLDLVRHGDLLVAEGMFRDSHVTDEGSELVIHEYALRASFDPETLTVVDIEADPRTLPWVECPDAAASALRVVGRSAHDLRTWVRAELVGVPTCTHLNDQLRSLEDVVALAGHLAAGAPVAGGPARS
jgi:hypothetical protein